MIKIILKKEIGFELTWEKNKWSSNITLNNKKFNPRHEELWNYCIKWHLDMLNRFYDTFYPRINEYENIFNVNI